MRILPLIIIILAILSCNKPMKNNEENPYVVVLGVAQDAGYPQAGCNKTCCEYAWKDHSKRKNVSCLAIVDPISKEQWIFDATPDVKFQLQLLEEKSSFINTIEDSTMIENILITAGWNKDKKELDYVDFTELKRVFIIEITDYFML